MHFHKKLIENSQIWYTVPGEERGQPMFRLWGRTFRDNHMLSDIVIENGSKDTRTHKVFDGLEKICYAFDLSKPIWLDSVIADFQRTSRARFYQDSFIDRIDFDYLEIQIIEED